MAAMTEAEMLAAFALVWDSDSSSDSDDDVGGGIRIMYTNCTVRVKVEI